MNLINSFLDSMPEKPLFHYTTTAGLRGIFDTRTVWASSIYHLNDSQELKYAMDLIGQRLKERLKAASNAETNTYEELNRQIENGTEGIQVYVSSFSEEGDLLSQWLTYSGSNGYALGISRDALEFAKSNGFYLVKCAYAEELQLRLADAFIDALCTPDPSESGEKENLRTEKALVAAAGIKHPGFSREAEWRLIKPIVIGLGHGKIVRFREGRNGLVPYIHAPLCHADDLFTPETIYIGPNSEMATAKMALETFLDFYELAPWLGNHPVRVVPSKTPYRP